MQRRAAGTKSLDVFWIQKTGIQQPSTTQSGVFRHVCVFTDQRGKSVEAFTCEE